MSTTESPRATAGTTEGVAAGGQAVEETLEDYTLRFAPRSYRRWTPMVVATTALGGIAYMADFSIGAGIGLAHGTGNALLAIAVAAVVIFVTGFPLAYYGARYNIDLTSSPAAPASATTARSSPASSSPASPSSSSPSKARSWPRASDSASDCHSGWATPSPPSW